MAGWTEWKWVKGTQYFLSSAILSLLQAQESLNKVREEAHESDSSLVSLQSMMELHQRELCPTALSV